MCVRKYIVLAALVCIAWLPLYAQKGVQQLVVNSAVPVGAVTWTVPHDTSNYTCTGSDASVTTASCTVTGITSATAGNALLCIVSAYAGADGTVTAPSFTSCVGNNGSDTTWVKCPTGTSNPNHADQEAANNWYLLGCSTIVNAAGGTTSVTANIAFGISTGTGNWYMDVKVVEIHRSTGTATVDDTAGGSLNASCSSCAGPNLTLTGASDYVMQWDDDALGCTTAGATYVNPYDNDSAANGIYSDFAGALNQSSGTGPTFTCTTGNFFGSAVSLK